MNTTINDRFKKLLEYYNIDQTAFGIYLDCTQSYVNQLTKTKSIGKKTAEKILSYFTDVNPIWFMMGEGSMLKTPLSPSQIIENHQAVDNLDITGYYFPDVNASAGLDILVENTEVHKLAVSIPTFGKGLHFINVFGDSMYPKFRSGEVIGIKAIEYKYLNFGYPYVIILGNGEVFLKYIKKGRDDDHVILASENPFYDPKEFHISDIDKIYSIKGIISQLMM
jgi:SOS-response transcriptional repressor LexA